MRLACPLALAAALVLLAGCDQADPNFTTPDALGAPDLVPLAVGNEWVMEGTQLWAERPGSGSTPPDLDLGLATLRVVGDTLIGGERWFDVQFANRPDGSCHGGLFANRHGSLYTWSEEDGAVVRAPTGPFTPRSETSRQYDFEVRRTLLPEPGQVTVGEETLPTQRVEFAPLRYLGATPTLPSAVDDTVREVDEYVPGIGFAVSECAYVTLPPDADALTLAITERYVLTGYTLVGEDE